MPAQIVTPEKQVRSAHLIANNRSGKGAAVNLPELAQEVAARHGVDLKLYPTDDRHDFGSQIVAAVEAAEADHGVVIAAGGDGTIRSVAQIAAGRGVKFGAVPCGTFNFFARSHNIPEDPLQALDLIFAGAYRPVRLGLINDKYFLINATFGLYAHSIKEREKSTRRWGRNRLVVVLSTMKSLLHPRRLINVDLISGGETVSLETASVFIGNNTLQLRDLAIDVASCMASNLLAVVVLKPVNRLEMLRIFWRGLAKTLSQETRLSSFCAESLVINLPQRSIMTALDGEIFYLNTPINIVSCPGALMMALPENK